MAPPVLTEARRHRTASESNDINIWEFQASVSVRECPHFAVKSCAITLKKKKTLKSSLLSTFHPAGWRDASLQSYTAQITVNFVSSWSQTSKSTIKMIISLCNQTIKNVSKKAMRWHHCHIF